MRKFIIYLASGNLQFETKNFNLVFMLAVTFQVRGFFRCLIEMNVALPFENQLTRNILFNCCFNLFNDLLSQDGENNFVHWMLGKYSEYNLLKVASKIFEDDVGSLETFIIQYINFKSNRGILSSVDVDELVNSYVLRGKTPDEARQRIKRSIPWENTKVEVMKACQKSLKFTEDEMKSYLQKKLARLSSANV